MIGFIIVAVMYVVIVWRVLSVEDREKQSRRAIEDLQARVAYLEDELVRQRNAHLMATPAGG
jgi:hypothetical protein